MPKVTGRRSGDGMPFPRGTFEVRLAINLFDVTDRLNPAVLGAVARTGLDLTGRAFQVGPEKDDRGVLFTCGLLGAACLCDVIRNHDREAGDAPTRVYVDRGKGRGWERLPGTALLTLVHDGNPYLNPAVFPVTMGSSVGGSAGYDPITF